MALVHADRVKETSTTTGTGTYDLDGAATGFQTFVAGIGTTNTCYYVAEDGTDWEVGIGTVTDATPDTLARTTILASSNSGSAVNWGAGTKNLFVSIPADRFVGQQTIWVPASAMYAPVTSGAASGSVELATNDVQLVTWDFDDAADEYVQFSVTFPKSYDLGTITFVPYWTVNASVTTGVAWGLQALALNDNEAIDAAWGTAVVVTDDAQSAANELLIGAESGAVTVGAAADDLVFFRAFRDVSDANDDMTQDALLIGIKILFTTEAPTDD